MAARKTTEEKNVAPQEGEREAKKVLAYNVIGKRYESAREAHSAVREAYKKGFKSTGLCVKAGEFAVLFGTYETEAAAKANLSAILKAGFDAEIETII